MLTGRALTSKCTRGILICWSLRARRAYPQNCKYGVKVWKEIDDTIFKLPKERHVRWLAERRTKVIWKLNADFTRPWFGWKDGLVAEDLGEVAYEEATLRMVHLMFVEKESRWII
jgi:fatty acid synthase subunit alpha, fungi type